MSGIQLGEKQITLEDCDAIVFDKVPVVVDPSFVTKIQKTGKGKYVPAKTIEIENREVRSVTGVSRSAMFFTLMSLLKGEGISEKLINACIQYLNSENEEINLFAFEEAILKLEGEGAVFTDREKDIINCLSPRTNAITYLIFKQGEKLNDLFLVVYALIISVLGGKIDSLSETIYEINRPHRCAAYVAQMLRLLLFGATLKEDFDEHIGAIPELVGPLTDLVKKLKISIQPELNAPSAIKGSTLLVSALNNLSYQYTMIMSHVLEFVECLKEKEVAVYEKVAEAGAEYTKNYKEAECKLSMFGKNATLQYPYLVLLQQQYIMEFTSILIQQLYCLLQNRIQQSMTVVEEKKIDPEIQARLDAERAKEEAEMDPVKLAKIREKRAAKEAKKNKKVGNKTKKLNIGNGLQLILDTIISSYSTLEGDIFMKNMNLFNGSFYSLLASQYDGLKSGGVHRKPKVPKGTRDFLPEQMEIRTNVMNTIRGVFRRHGAVEIDTPVFEERETLMGKYGEDSKLIYDLADQGGEILSLRYDLTVPFARFLAIHQVGNIKRFHIAKVYRRDNPVVTKGRYREFYQCDFDIAGSYGNMISDADVLAVGVEIYKALNIGDFTIKVNNRELLDSMMEICGVPTNKIRAIGSAIDKLDKETWETVRHEMVEKKGLAPEAADRIHDFVSIKGDVWEVYNQLLAMESIQQNARAMKALEDMKKLFEYIGAMGYLDSLTFDMSLARGLDYYTGLIYEVVLVNNPYGVGSIGAGGRYDHLVGMFNAGGKDIPCVGISIGVERVFTILEKKAEAEGKLKCTPCSVLIASIGKDMTAHRMKLAAELWRSGISAEFGYQENPKLQKQLTFALESGINWLVIMGEEEVKEGKVNLKNLAANTEITIPMDSLVDELRKQGLN